MIIIPLFLFLTLSSATISTSQREIEIKEIDNQIEQPEIQPEREQKEGFFDKKDFEYCSSNKRKPVVYGLTIGYPIVILCISVILLGLGRRIPVINVFISPCIFSALVVMIDRIVCNEDVIKVVITSGIYVLASV